MSERPTGTKEWAPESSNILIGCQHDCRYCYARANAVRRKICTAEEWAHPRLRKSPPNVPKNTTVMFPSTHDLCPTYREAIIEHIQTLLLNGNKVIIVTKGGEEEIIPIAGKLINFKDSVLFRLTITSDDDEVLKFWEPGAPTHMKRWWALCRLFDSGFQTSVSIEPYLGTRRLGGGPGTLYSNVICLGEKVTETIWIGAMNDMDRRVDLTGPFTPEEQKYIQMAREQTTVEVMRDNYELLKSYPKVRWKDSYKKALKLGE